MELCVRNLSKSYDGRAVLENVSFTAPVGLTRIAGNSGIGKTTLLRILLGLETPDGGEVAPKNLRLDAAGNLRFALGAAYDDSRAKALLGALGLGDVGGKKVCDYSGGMKRRLALARALLAPCDALALDEPFTGLDRASRDAALRAVLRAAEEKIVLLAAHETLALPTHCGEVKL